MITTIGTEMENIKKKTKQTTRDKKYTAWNIHLIRLMTDLTSRIVNLKKSKKKNFK